MFSGASAVNTRAHTSLPSAHEAAGALGTRHSPRPLQGGAMKFSGKPRAFQRRETAMPCFSSLTFESDARNDAALSLPRERQRSAGRVARRARSDRCDGWGLIGETNAVRSAPKAPHPTGLRPATLPATRSRSRGEGEERNGRSRGTHRLTAGEKDQTRSHRYSGSGSAHVNDAAASTSPLTYFAYFGHGQSGRVRSGLQLDGISLLALFTEAVI